MPRRHLARPAVAAALLVLGCLSAAAPAGAAAPPMRVTAREDLLGLSTRLVFSASRNVATSPRAVTLTNRGSATIRVSDLRFGGQDAGQFVLASGQPQAFSIAPGRSATVGVRFRPRSIGNKFATLTIVNSSASPRYLVKLRGVRARGTIGSTEPQLAQLMQLFGYTTNVGFSHGNQATTAALRGEEVRSPYFVRAAAGEPVRLIPIARYTAATTSGAETGRNPRGSRARQPLYRYPGDPFVDPNPNDGMDSSVYGQNQMTFPSISAGTFAFAPRAAFGIYGNGTNYTDDRFNVAPDGSHVHNIRVYPAKGAGGVRIGNAWILALDTKFAAADKNFDYQDQVMLLTNARPA